jgi:hypothetical protein
MADLVLSILVHVALGLALAGVVWASGAGWLAVFRPRPEHEAETALAYPVGFVVTFAAAALVLFRPSLAPVAALLALGCFAWGRGRTAVADLAGRAGGHVLLALPLAVATAVALGLLWHGPDAGRAGGPLDDTVYYVAAAKSAETATLPFPDLLVEGDTYRYLETAEAILAADLNRIPGVDLFLVYASTLPAFLLLSLAIGFSLVASQPTSTAEAVGGRVVMALPLLAFGALGYPSWLVESPPVTLGLPLAFALFTLAVWPPARPSAFVVLAGLVFVAAAAAKTILVVPLAAALVVAGRRAFPLRGIVGRLALAVGAVAIVAVGAVATRSVDWVLDLIEPRFLPVNAVRDAVHALPEPSFESRGLGLSVLAAPLIIAGELALLTAVFRMRRWALAAALAVSVAGQWLVQGLNFDGAVGASALAVVALCLVQPAELARQRTALLLAGLLLSASSWLRELSEPRYALVLSTMLLGALIAAQGPTLLEIARAGGRPRVVVHAAAAAVAVLFAGFVVALAAGLTSVGPARITLTPADHDVWGRVAKAVPPDGLVFTSLTGREPAPRRAYNYFAAVAGRQVYLAGWFAGRLYVEPAEAERRLDLNARVLSGELRPDRIPLRGEYSSYWAVIERERPAPHGARLVYDNGVYRIYRLRG